MSILKFVIACALVALQSTALFAQDLIVAGEKRTDDVARIFMHTPTSFSLLVPADSDKISWKLIDASDCNGHVCDEFVFIPDVPEDQPMWHRVFRFKKPGDWSFTDRAEFHIHVVADIEGGGWRKTSGKVTHHGMTDVVQ